MNSIQEPSDLLQIPQTPPLSQQNITNVVDHLSASSKSKLLKNDLSLRKMLLIQLRELITLGEKMLLQAAWMDMHRHPSETFIIELQFIQQDIQYHLDMMSSWSKPEKKSTDLINTPGVSYVHKEPFGLVCIIGSWNYALHVLLMPLIGSISAGNCTVLRFPDQDTCSNTIGALIHLIDTYMDKRFVGYVYGGPEETKFLLEQKFDLIFATGGQALGRIVARAAAEHLCPVVLELGGKSPSIVDDTADIELAARRIAWGGFTNAGQICVRPDYIMVHQSLGDLFVRKLQERLAECFGADAKMSDSYGRIVNKRMFDRLELTLQKDAKHITHGGQVDAKTLYIEPTILNFKDDVNAFLSSAVMQVESFGPLLPVYYYKDFEETLRIVNERPKPLTLSIFSSSKTRKEKLLSCTSSGSCSINDVMTHVLNSYLPFGGVGASGSGCYHGQYSFETFSHRRAVIYKTKWLDLAARYQPYTSGKDKLMRFLLRPISSRTVSLSKASFLIAVIAIVYGSVCTTK